MMNMSNEKKAQLDREINYSISCNVGNLYILASHMGYDLKSFSDLFLTSHFCARSFDTEYSRFQNEEEDVSMEYLLREISPDKEKTDNIFDSFYLNSYIGCGKDCSGPQNADCETE